MEQENVESIKSQKIFTVTKNDLDNLKDEKCPICIENMNENQIIINTSCNHLFHKKCFSKYCKPIYEKCDNNNILCPICRKIACNNNFYYKIFYDNFLKKYIKIDKGDIVKVKSFGNVTFKVTGFKRIYYRTKHKTRYYKKFYNGKINNFMNVSFQRKDLEKINLKKAIVYCEKCKEESLTNFIDYEYENSNCTDQCDFMDSSDNNAVNYEKFIDDNTNEYYACNIPYDVISHECTKCFSFNTNLVEELSEQNTEE